MTDEKDHIVVMLDCYNDQGLREFDGVLGPYTKSEADARVDELESRELYAQKFQAVKLGVTKHHTDEWD